MNWQKSFPAVKGSVIQFNGQAIDINNCTLNDLEKVLGKSLKSRLERIGGQNNQRRFPWELGEIQALFLPGAVIEEKSPVLELKFLFKSSEWIPLEAFACFYDCEVLGFVAPKKQLINLKGKFLAVFSLNFQIEFQLKRKYGAIFKKCTALQFFQEAHVRRCVCNVCPLIRQTAFGLRSP